MYKHLLEYTLHMRENIPIYESILDKYPDAQIRPDYYGRTDYRFISKKVNCNFSNYEFIIDGWPKYLILTLYDVLNIDNKTVKIFSDPPSINIATLNGNDSIYFYDFESSLKEEDIDISSIRDKYILAVLNFIQEHGFSDDGEKVELIDLDPKIKKLLPFT